MKILLFFTAWLVLSIPAALLFAPYLRLRADHFEAADVSTRKHEDGAA